MNIESDNQEAQQAKMTALSGLGKCKAALNMMNENVRANPNTTYNTISRRVLYSKKHGKTNSADKGLSV
ncbi:hypothetical protein [Spartinivicinus poritis]|uniref:Uncharacterized protein n=1 Tax=Spartinivicinus poritis TaxID=2994640 RepID=A0ABT5U3T7_9GAMM|nr:hypothetical protein [Spartinivicinus sp. A2-2]MDE1461021.1 hypothetical protein [Spartinivicinus sp. A2-2]